MSLRGALCTLKDGRCSAQPANREHRAAPSADGRPTAGRRPIGCALPVTAY